MNSFEILRLQSNFADQLARYDALKTNTHRDPAEICKNTGKCMLITIGVVCFIGGCHLMPLIGFTAASAFFGATKSLDLIPTNTRRAGYAALKHYRQLVKESPDRAQKVLGEQKLCVTSMPFIQFFRPMPEKPMTSLLPFMKKLFHK